MFSSFISLGLSWLPGPLGILAALASIVLGLLVDVYKRQIITVSASVMGWPSKADT